MREEFRQILQDYSKDITQTKEVIRALENTQDEVFSNLLTRLPALSALENDALFDLLFNGTNPADYM